MTGPVAQGPARLRPILLGGAPFVALLGAWGLLSALLSDRLRYLFPGPLETAAALWDSRTELLVGTASSFLVLAPGYLGAVLLGLGLGLAVGTSSRLQRLTLPLARVAAPTPPTVYVPYAIALLPTFRLAAIFIVLAAAFWPVFLNAAAGARAVPERHRDNARVLGFGRLEYVRRVALPAALPHAFNGAQVSLGLSFIMLTVAELFGAGAGLGRFVQYYSDFADYPRMLAGIVYTGLVAFLAMSALGRLERRLVFWPH